MIHFKQQVTILSRNNKSTLWNRRHTNLKDKPKTLQLSSASTATASAGGSGDGGDDGDNGSSVVEQVLDPQNGDVSTASASVAGAASNVTVNVQNIPPQVKAKPTPSKKKSGDDLCQKISDFLDEEKKNQENDTAVDFAFASYSKRMRQFLSDSQQEEVLQDIGEIVMAAVRQAKARRQQAQQQQHRPSATSAPPPPLAPAPTARLPSAPPAPPATPAMNQLLPLDSGLDGSMPQPMEAQEVQYEFYNEHGERILFDASSQNLDQM